MREKKLREEFLYSVRDLVDAVLKKDRSSAFAVARCVYSVPDNAPGLLGQFTTDTAMTFPVSQRRNILLID